MQAESQSGAQPLAWMQAPQLFTAGAQSDGTTGCLHTASTREAGGAATPPHLNGRKAVILAHNLGHVDDEVGGEPERRKGRKKEGGKNAAAGGARGARRPAVMSPALGTLHSAVSRKNQSPVEGQALAELVAEDEGADGEQRGAALGRRVVARGSPQGGCRRRCHSGLFPPRESRPAAATQSLRTGKSDWGVQGGCQEGAAALTGERKWGIGLSAGERHAGWLTHQCQSAALSGKAGNHEPHTFQKGSEAHGASAQILQRNVRLVRYVGDRSTARGGGLRVRVGRRLQALAAQCTKAPNSPSEAGAGGDAVV